MIANPLQTISLDGPSINHAYISTIYPCWISANEKYSPEDTVKKTKATIERNARHKIVLFCGQKTAILSLVDSCLLAVLSSTPD
jgi:hypothetical protein